MKLLTLTVSLFLFALSASGQFPWSDDKFDFPDGKIKESKICANGCLSGTPGLRLPFYKALPSPEIDDKSTEQSVALSILGRTHHISDRTGMKHWTCSSIVKSPFTADDITRVAAGAGTKMVYSKKEKLNLDIESAVQTNLHELRVANPRITLAQLDDFEASLRFEYFKFAEKELEIKGIYSEWALKQEVVQALAMGLKFQDCASFLTSRNYQIVTSIGLVNYNISYATNSVDTIALALQSKAESAGLKASFSFSFKREIAKDLKKTTPNLFQILVWRTQQPPWN